jgi:hypothetical protein
MAGYFAGGIAAIVGLAWCQHMAGRRDVEEIKGEGFTTRAQ